MTASRHQVFHQGVHRIVGTHPIVACDGHIYAFRHHLALEALQLAQHLVGDHHGIGAGTLADGQGHRRHLVTHALALLRHGMAEGKGRETVLMSGTFLDVCDVFQVNGPSLRRPDHDIAQFLDVTERRGDPQRHLAVGMDQFAGGQHDIGALQHLGDLIQADAHRRQLLRVDPDIDRLGLAADHLAVADVGDVAQLGQHAFGDLAQGHVADLMRGQRQGHDRHIGDADALDDGLHGAGRQPVHVAHDLVVEGDQAFLLVRPHLELHRDHAHVVQGVAEGVLHALQAGHQSLERLDHLIADLQRAAARPHDDNLRRRHHDLGVVQAGRDGNGEQTPEGQRQHDQCGDLGLDKSAGELTRAVELLIFAGTHALPPLLSFFFSGD
jgi:hypothetical protein